MFTPLNTSKLGSKSRLQNRLQFSNYLSLRLKQITSTTVDGIQNAMPLTWNEKGRTLKHFREFFNPKKKLWFSKYVAWIKYNITLCQIKNAV